MKKYRILFLILGLAFIYCWIKFYSFYEGTSQGLYGSTSKGDFFFYLEFIPEYFKVAFFVCSIFFALKVSKNKEEKLNRRLLVIAFLFLLFAIVFGTLSYQDYNEHIFVYLSEHYEHWTFWSANFLMEYVILNLVSVPLFLFKWISYYLWKRA